MKLPIALVKTWLELSSTNNPESPVAHTIAIKKIFHYFGSYRDAELYINKNTNHQ
jgi:hypothetical protein